MQTTNFSEYFERIGKKWPHRQSGLDCGIVYALGLRPQPKNSTLLESPGAMAGKPWEYLLNFCDGMSGEGPGGLPAIEKEINKYFLDENSESTTVVRFNLYALPWARDLCSC
jgi:hypothetical protein